MTRQASSSRVDDVGDVRPSVGSALLVCASASASGRVSLGAAVGARVGAEGVWLRLGIWLGVWLLEADRGAAGEGGLGLEVEADVYPSFVFFAVGVEVVCPSPRLRFLPLGGGSSMIGFLPTLCPLSEPLDTDLASGRAADTVKAATT